MKIWRKMLFAMIIGMILGLVVPKDVLWFKDLLKLIGDISLNLLLYFTIVYIVVKVFLGFYSIKTDSVNKVFLIVFIITIVVSTMFSIILSIGLMNFDIFQAGKEFRVFQIKGKPIEIYGFGEILKNIISPNVLSIFQGPVKYILPLFFLGAIFGITGLFCTKKMLFFLT